MSTTNATSAVYEELKEKQCFKREEIDEALKRAIPGTKVRIQQREISSLPLEVVTAHITRVIGDIIMFDRVDVPSVTGVEFARYLRDKSIPLKKWVYVDEGSRMTLPGQKTKEPLRTIEQINKELTKIMRAHGIKEDFNDPEPAYPFVCSRINERRVLCDD